MRILLAVDDSKFSEAAVREVAERGHTADSEARVLTVVEPMPVPADGQVWGFALDMNAIQEEQKKAAQELVAGAADTLRRAGWKVSTAVETGDPKSSILDQAKEWKADLIVVGSHGRRGLDRFLLGSVSEAVARHARCSIEIVRIPSP
ncbi:MAG TPA: universal stress protein [Candidatus Acidoferrales bacterium]|nr:universal stress protein [Candidatus Acidoferrales bacterium]